MKEILRLSNQWINGPQRNGNFSRNLMLGERKEASQRGNFSFGRLTVLPTCCNTLQDETEIQTMTDESMVCGTTPCWDFFNVHIIRAPFKLEYHFRIRRQTQEGSSNPLFFLQNMGILKKSFLFSSINLTLLMDLLRMSSWTWLSTQVVTPPQVL